MLPLINIPTLVEKYSLYFRDLFSEDAFAHFRRYLSGLLVCENKTVEAINRLFIVEPRNQSSLNRFLNASPYSEQALNERRLAMLQDRAATAMKGSGGQKGSLSLDDTLLPHYGECFDNISNLYDTDRKCFTYAHNLVTLHYSDDQVDYPTYYKLWLPPDLEKIEAFFDQAGVYINPDKRVLKHTKPSEWRSYLLQRYQYKQYKFPELPKIYQSKLWIGRHLLEQFFERHPDLDLPVSFDSWYTQPALCSFIDQDLERAYVGTLQPDNRIVRKGHELQYLEDFANQLKAEHLDEDSGPVFEKTTVPYKGAKETYYTYCATHRIKAFGKQRLVISYRKEDLSDQPRFFITNRRHWHASGIVRIRRHRWPVEVYHQEGKAEGLDKYQVRNFQAINRHIACVVVLYSMLQMARHDAELLQQLQGQIESGIEGSLAFWRRLSTGQAFMALVQWIFLKLKNGESMDEILQPLLRTIAY